MRILLAIDDSTCSAAATKSVIAQFLPAHTLVHVLHADEWPSGLPVATTFVEGAGAAERVLAVHDLRRRVAAALVASAADALRAAGFTTVESIGDGNARDVIVACAKEWRADLVVLGSHGRTGLDRVIMGSVSDSVARRATCSVEIVRAAPTAA